MSDPVLGIDAIDADVAIVGSGGAGLMCALHLNRAAPDLDIVIVSKGQVGRSGCTLMVQGGFNAVLNARDSVENHFMDTLKGGVFLNDQDLAWTLVNDAPRVIDELETRVGCFFDRDESGHIHQKPFAGQSFDRTIHRGDQTGIEIMGRLRDQMFRFLPRELGDVRALDILLDDRGEAAGVSLLDVRTGAVVILRARVVVVATGGGATMYRIAAPAREKTADGMAMCYRAGLDFRDMEMLQFHPTGLLAGQARLTGSVLEEGLRGAGAYLYNALGERFMARYDADRMERSTRDVVARASYMEIIAGRGTAAGGVLIDISHLGAEEVEQRFPGMVARTRQIGRDLAREPIEVSPTSHFQMGGVMIDMECRTSVPGLLVAGEDAGGVHGANRLGGNGVAESTVFGARAGDQAAILAQERGRGKPDPAQVMTTMARTFAPLRRESGPSPFAVTSALKDIMWEGCGLVRDRHGLERAAQRLVALAEDVGTIAVPGPIQANYAWQEALDVVNQVIVARMMVESALVREESRGAHFRSDFPERDDQQWLKYILVDQAPDGAPRVKGLCPVKFGRIQPETRAPGDGQS